MEKFHKIRRTLNFYLYVLNNIIPETYIDIVYREDLKLLSVQCN